MSGAPTPSGSRVWTGLLVVLALTLPVGILLQPWLLPSRSALPVVLRQLHTPVLLVTVPGLRADRVHHLGAAREATPALDELARHSVSFPMFYADGNEAGTSLAALFTGRCAGQTGVHGEGDRLPPGVETLAERLAADGYATGAVLADPGALGRGFEQGFRTVRALPGADAATALDAALQILRDAPAENVFVWADLADLLPPYGGPALDNRVFAPDAPAGFGAAAGDSDLDAAALVARGWNLREIGWLAARYDAALLALDAALGRCVQTLADEGRLESMVVCVTGTRGERLDDRLGELPWRGFTHGGDLREWSLHVPLLLRLPGQTCRGLLPRRLAQTADLAPTLAEIGGHHEWETPQGRSLVPVILWQQRVHKVVVAEGLVQSERGGPGWRGYAQRVESLKLLVDGSGRARGAWRIPEDSDEREPVGLQPLQVQAVRDQAADWPPDCLPR